ncbi:MAG: 8-oxoguanine deaminase [Spirochaeta sp. LUC14_002_19_P3]|nr:MAG: 8-oxoguanine deaminase [Spirochaeta sp. LUC14_002_19_P3]
MILLKNCYHLVPGADSAGLSGVDLLIEGNIIRRIAKDIPVPSKDTRIIDASRHVVIPGLVNTHHHYFQTLTRNLPAAQNAKLFDWLIYHYEIWKNLDEEGVYWSTALAAGELLKTGCTLSSDHHYLYPRGLHGDIMAAQFAAAEKIGMRFSPTRGFMSLSKKDGGLPPDSIVQTEEVILKDSERVIKEFHDASPLSMRRIVLAPCSPFSVTEQAMRDTAALARKHGVLLHTHLAETEDENAYCMEHYSGRRPLKLMEDCDFVGPDVWYAHGICFNDDELKVLKETSSQVCHCPASNMRLASGICRVKEMKAMGINVSLGVDGSASNDSSDMLGELRNAMLLQRVTKGADALTARDVLKMGTENGACLLNFPSCGQLKEGMAADMALFDIFRMEYAGSHSDPLAALVFCGYHHGADYTIVNGKVAVEEGRLTGIDEDDLFRNAQAAAERLVKDV